MRISLFHNKSSDNIKGKTNFPQVKGEYILSPGDEVSLGSQMTAGDEGWDQSSKLQQFAEQQEQENIALKKEVERLKKRTGNGERKNKR